jgi:hypothetical protein
MSRGKSLHGFIKSLLISLGRLVRVTVTLGDIDFRHIAIVVSFHLEVENSAFPAVGMLDHFGVKKIDEILALPKQLFGQFDLVFLEERRIARFLGLFFSQHGLDSSQSCPDGVDVVFECD